MIPAGGAGLALVLGLTMAIVGTIVGILIGATAIAFFHIGARVQRQMPYVVRRGEGGQAALERYSQVEEAGWVNPLSSSTKPGRAHPAGPPSAPPTTRRLDEQLASAANQARART